MRMLTYATCFAALAALLAVSRPAAATLGQGADSIARDRQALSATKGISKKLAKCTFQEVNTEGTAIREYQNSSGIVFGIAWNGMVPPDLNTLLGSYAGEYQQAKKQTARRYGQKRAKVTSSNVVVETWGHMRNLQGRAYVPALLPEGVSANDIK